MEELQNETQQARQRRTFELTVLVVIFLMISILGWLRLWQAVENRELIAALNARPGPFYLAVGGAAWGLAGLACAAGLWLRQAWGPWLARIVISALAAWYWVDRLLFARSPGSQSNTPSAILFTFLLVAFVLIVLALPRQKRFFLHK
jgi:hypothetical protein